MPACAPVACKTSKVLLDVISVSSHEVEPTTAAEVAPSLAPSLAEVQRPEAAVAITIPGARWVGGGLPDGQGVPVIPQAYHAMQPLARTTEAAAVTPSGVLQSIGLRVRRLRDGCTKFCFSPIGAVLLLCCFSLLYCVAEILNTGANGAECNATGFGPMPVCICVPPSATRSSSTLRLLGNSLCYPLWTCPNPDLVLPINPDLPRAQARVRQSVSRTSRA